ncbi:MAG: uncharacterized protein QOC65_372 [Sphingomonadales bacterium]|nr:uncharacterized protein [Sphingomonadales bacterium]
MRRPALIAALLLLGIAGPAAAVLQETATALRATGLVGEQYDGYLGLVGAAPPRVRSEMDAVNIRRRAHYTELARLRRARVEEVGVAAACEILAGRVGPGQYYLLPDGVWRRRDGNEPVLRPAYCR